MWMLIPLSFSTLLLVHLIPGLERYEDENYRTQVLTQGLLGIQNEAYAFGQANQNFVGRVPSYAIQLQSRVEWHAEIINGHGGRFILTWLSDFMPDYIPTSLTSDFPAFAEFASRSGFFWGKYTIRDTNSGLVGTTVVPKPTLTPADGLLIVGDLL